MWFRVDDRFIRHRKVSQAARMLGGPEHIGRIVAVWLEAGLWASENLSDGFVPDVEVSVFRTDIKGRPEQVMNACVAAGLLKRISSDVEPGYQFHDWDHYQPAAHEIKAKRARDRDRKRAAANGHPGPRALLPESIVVLDGVVVEAVCAPPRLLAESNAIPERELSARARASAGDPVPVPVPLGEQEICALARALPAPGDSQIPPMLRVRVSVWEVRPHLLAAIHQLVASGAPYVDSDGEPDRVTLLDELKVIASRHLNAEWHGRELQTILDAALGRRASMLEAEVAEAAFRRRERRDLERARRQR